MPKIGCLPGSDAFVVRRGLLRGDSVRGPATARWAGVEALEMTIAIGQGRRARRQGRARGLRHGVALQHAHQGELDEWG